MRSQRSFLVTTAFAEKKISPQQRCLRFLLGAPLFLNKH